MRKDITITADAREMRGKNAARRLRVEGKIPAVLYGAGKDSVAVTVSPKEVNKILHTGSGHNTIFNLDVPGQGSTPVMVVDWLHHPIKDTLMHIDMLRIDLTKALRVKVPIHATGEPEGVKIHGGHFEFVFREIEFECLPDEIPEHITVDISALLIGQSIRAQDLAVSGSMKLVSPADTVVCHVVALRDSLAEAAPVEGEAAAAVKEPEVAKKGKKEEAVPAAGEKKPAEKKPAEKKK
ncbi:MAG TPA: 50S ribosomal protein L25 [Bryobacteraceae bacterium]|jgi:large subunit ribosomal protein L25|nr:50S ribosomal protein L25 [Bryobacteraceae bacterium]